MSKRERIFQNLIPNVLIVTVLLVVAFIGFSGGSVSVFSSNKIKAYYRGNTQNKNVSFMFNVYWGEEYISGFISTLDKYNAKATFFVGGCYAAKNEDMVKAIFNSGNELGNHGYYHKDCTKITSERIREEISITDTLIKSITSQSMILFAPPSGAVNESTIEVADSLNYKTIMWSKDTIDWRDKDSGIVYQRAIKNAQNGDLILMHPGQHTLNALDSILKFYTDNGYKIVTVSENISGI